MPYGSELRWVSSGGPMGGAVNLDKLIVDGYLGYLALSLSQQDTSWSADTLMFDRASADRLLPMAALYDASNPDLTAFRDRGGRPILYHGWADDSISPLSTLAYYAALQQRMGGLESTQPFARLFMFPGVYHCSGGEGSRHWDMLGPIIGWVERDEAPMQIVATQSESDLSTAGVVSRTRRTSLRHHLARPRQHHRALGAELHSALHLPSGSCCSNRSSPRASLGA